MWDSTVFRKREKNNNDGDGSDPPKISIDHDATIVLPDGTEIEIKAGVAPNRVIRLNKYIAKVSRENNRLYSIEVRRPTGEHINVNSLGIRLTGRPTPSNRSLKSKNIYSLNTKEIRTMKNLFFMVNDGGEVVSVVQNYNKE